MLLNACYSLLPVTTCLLLPLAFCYHLLATTYSKCFHLFAAITCSLLSSVAPNSSLLLLYASYCLLQGLPVVCCYLLFTDPTYLQVSLACRYCLPLATTCLLLQLASCYLFRMQHFACKIQLTSCYRRCFATAYMLPTLPCCCIMPAVTVLDTVFLP